MNEMTPLEHQVPIHIMADLNKNNNQKSCVFLDPSTNFRVDPKHHRQYDAVFFEDENIFSSKSWPLKIDEMIRLIDREGYLYCRYQDNFKGDIISLKSQMARHPDLKVTLVSQVVDKVKRGRVCFRVIKRQYEEEKSWSIGIITNGKKNDNVKSLILKFKSLHQSKSDLGDIEFIVSGEFDSQWARDNGVHLVDLPVTDQLPRVSEKKSLISKKSQYDNVIIFHDRYQIDDNFFEGFDKFGYDFDLVTVTQHYEDGSFFPGYAGVMTDRKQFALSYFSKNPGVIFDYLYLNGGIMIFKKTVLKQLDFNELLLHQEAEDLELCKMMKALGMTPRWNIYSNAMTFGIPSDYTDSFIEVFKEEKSGIKDKVFLMLVNCWKCSPKSIKSYINSTGLKLFIINRFSK